MVLDRIALILVVVGALNWGLIGLFGLDLVAFIFGGQMAVVSRVIYALVGLGGLWCVSLLFRERVPGQSTVKAVPGRWSWVKLRDIHRRPAGLQMSGPDRQI